MPQTIQITLDVTPVKTRHRLPKDFTAAVNMLTRPYIPITKEQYDQIVAMTKSDFVLCSGIFCTFGTADGGFALMPIAPKHTPDEFQIWNTRAKPSTEN